MGVFENMTVWHWLIGAGILLILEVAAPGAVFLWMGVAAAAVGLLLAVLPLAWQVQWILFAVLSIGSVFGWRAYKRARPDIEEYPTLNQRRPFFGWSTFYADRADRQRTWPRERG